MTTAQPSRDAKTANAVAATVAGTNRRERTNSRPDVSNDEISTAAADSVAQIVKLEGRDRADMGAADHVADVMTLFSGSMLFVYLHALWFAIWIIVNEGPFPITKFDPFPFGFLTMIVSLEAIFLSTFVLISQNRQGMRADRRSKVDLQINMISEQEVTKIMQMVSDIYEHLGLDDGHDSDLHEMLQPTHVGKLADAVEVAEHEEIT